MRSRAGPIHCSPSLFSFVCSVGVSLVLLLWGVWCGRHCVVRGGSHGFVGCQCQCPDRCLQVRLSLSVGEAFSSDHA